MRADLHSGGSGRNESQLREVTATLRPILARLDALARTVLQIASLLAPDGIALPWVRAIASLSHPELADEADAGQTDLWTDLVRGLLGMRIFHSTPEPRVVAMHRILQRVLESELTEEREPLETKLLECVRHRAAALEKETHWQDARWELEPLEALAWLWAGPADGKDNAPPTHPAAAWLLNQVGLRRHDLADWSHAEPLYRHALAIDEASCGTDHPNVAGDLNNLARLLYATDRLSEAEALMRRALAIDEASYGKDHPNVAGDLNNLAQLLQATNRLSEAERLMRRSLEIVREIWGDRHPLNANGLVNLGRVLYELGRERESEELIRESIAIWEHSQTSNDPRLGKAFLALGLIESRRENLPVAKAHLAKALELLRQAPGSHPREIAEAQETLERLQ